MSALKKANTAIAIVLSIVVMGPVASWGVGLRPTSKEFSSQWIDITMGGMMAPPGEGLALVLNLKNKSSKPLQVSVAFVTPDPAQRCKVTKQLNSGQSAMFSCPQKSVTPNTDYPIDISIYSDKERKDLIEKPTTKFHFNEREAKTFAELARSLGAEKASAKTQPSLAKQARVIGGEALNIPIFIAPAEEAPPRNYRHAISVPEGKNRIAIQEQGKLLAQASQNANEKKGHFKEIEFYAKGGHEYLVDFASKFPIASYWKYRVTDTSTGEVVAKVDVTRH